MVTKTFALCSRKKRRERTLWWSGAGMPRSTLTGPRRTSPDPTSSKTMECRKSSRPFMFWTPTWMQIKQRILLIFLSVHFLRDRLVSHFYGHGDVCDLTGKPRQVIVKLKWVNGVAPSQHMSKTISSMFPGWFTHLISLRSVRCKESESPHAVTVYMLEPQTCQYILGVSSLVTN